MNVFKYENYRTFVINQFNERSPGGRGEIAKLAKKLKISASLVGRILKGVKNFTEEQAVATAAFFDLAESETDYFLALVQLERAGTAQLKNAVRRRLNRDRVQSLRQGPASVHANDLRPQDQAVFYSGWDFSAVRLMSSLSDFSDAESLARRLGLPQQRIRDILDFLFQAGLIVRKGDATLLGPTKTVVDQASPYRQRHHLNWRVKALELIPRASSSDISYTAPMTIRRSDAENLRKHLFALMDQAEKYMEDPDPDGFYCLLIDWFSI